jgi:hypothetical protein
VWVIKRYNRAGSVPSCEYYTPVNNWSSLQAYALVYGKRDQALGVALWLRALGEPARVYRLQAKT